MKFTELTSYLELLKSLSPGKESGLRETESFLSLPFSHLESIANLALALQYAPRDKDENFIPILPTATVTSSGDSSFSLNLTNFPGKNQSFSLMFTNDEQSRYGVRINPDSNTPGKIKAPIFSLEHLPLPTKLKPRLKIADSSLTISGMGYSWSETTTQAGELVTLESLQEKLSQVTTIIQKDRPNFHLDVLGTKSGETPMIVVVQTGGIFSVIKINLIKDETSAHGYKVLSQAHVNPQTKFAGNPHSAEMSRRLESTLNCLFLPFLYPDNK